MTGWDLLEELSELANKNDDILEAEIWCYKAKKEETAFFKIEKMETLKNADGKGIFLK